MNDKLAELLTELLKKGQFTTPLEKDLIEMIEKKLLEYNQ